MSQHPGDFEVVRSAPLAVRSRAASGAGTTMDVRFSPFDVWYEIDSAWEGRFLERTVNGAFTKTIAESGDRVRCLYDHGYDPQIGNKVLGTIEELREDVDTAVGVVDLFTETSYVRDLMPGLQAGVYGSSMRMRVVKEEWNDRPGTSTHNPNGIPERTITEVILYEFGPVTFPANPSATSGVRSATDEYYERLRTREPDRVDQLARAARTTGRRAGLTPAERRAALLKIGG